MMLFFLFFSACSYFPEKTSTVVETSVEIIVEEDFIQEVDALVEEVRILWKKREKVDKRSAQRKLKQFYEDRAVHVFSSLHSDHPIAVLEAEQQLGWVIHRLGRHTSHSFRREEGYLEKLSNKLHACASLLPEPPKPEPVEEHSVQEENASQGNSSVSAL
ncbi:MAG: hypothetical protein CL916_09480 [Deltaproteobacteria bacterium]|nr:hypothetical protein [Deltaproteobacteria bacterium]